MGRSRLVGQRLHSAFAAPRGAFRRAHMDNAQVGTVSGSPSGVRPPPAAMTPSRLSVLTALGLACLASTVLLVRSAPAPELSILDRIYS